MMNHVVTSCVFLYLVAFSSANDSKIVGGVETTIEDVPYQLELENGLLGVLWSFSCGAVIVGKNTVLTAGHCVYEQKENHIRFRSGDTTRGKGTIHETVSITLHPNYTQTEVSDNDLAVVQVNPPFELDATRQIVTLTESEPVEGDNATVSGWGVTSESSGAPPQKVRKVVVPIITRETCQENYDGLEDITDGMICAGLPEGGKDSCSGDSGGPLVVNGALAGLVSWGYGCAEPQYAGVYTNLNKYRSWIQPQIEAYEKLIQ